MENKTKTFGEVLKEIRKTRGDTLQGLADKIDVVFTYIDKIEKGLRPINKDILEKLIKQYPLNKTTLEKAYLNEVLPDISKSDPRILNLDMRGKRQLTDLIEESTLMFNDENISDEDKEKMLYAIQEAFFIAKQKNKRKK